MRILVPYMVLYRSHQNFARILWIYIENFCLGVLPEDPLCDVIGKFDYIPWCFYKFWSLFIMCFIFSVNTSDEPLKKKPRRCSNFVHEVAPGEKKKLSNYIREENHDTKIKEQDKIYTFQLICCGSSRWLVPHFVLK